MSSVAHSQGVTRRIPTKLTTSSRRSFFWSKWSERFLGEVFGGEKEEKEESEGGEKDQGKFGGFWGRGVGGGGVSWRAAVVRETLVSR